MYLIDRFSQLLRCEVVLHFINTWDIKYPLSRNFYVRKICIRKYNRGIVRKALRTIM